MRNEKIAAGLIYVPGDRITFYYYIYIIKGLQDLKNTPHN